MPAKSFIIIYYLAVKVNFPLDKQTILGYTAFYPNNLNEEFNMSDTEERVCLISKRTLKPTEPQVEITGLNDRRWYVSEAHFNSRFANCLWDRTRKKIISTPGRQKKSFFHPTARYPTVHGREAGTY